MRSALLLPLLLLAPVVAIAGEETPSGEADRLLELGSVLPAYDYVLKCSHAFNVLHARGVLGVSERAAYVGRVRRLACRVAEAWVEQREALDYPLKDRWS